MSSSNPSRFLNNAAGTEYALSPEEMFQMGVVEAFRDEVIFADSPAIQRKIISQGNSHQFYLMADTPDPEEHTPGDELLGQQFEIDEGNITIDGIVVAHHDVPLDQMRLANFDILGPLARKTGERIARFYDNRLARLLVLTARGAAVTKNGLSVHSGGNRVFVDNESVATAFPVSSTGASNFLDAAQELAEAMDNDNVPEGGRYMWIDPYIRRVLAKDTGIWDVQYAQNASGNNLQGRLIGKIAGFEVMVAKNRIPSANVTTGPSKYQGTFSVTSANSAVGRPVAIVAAGGQYGMAPVGIVQHGGVESVMVPDERRNTVFVKSQVLMGAGQLHPWCAGVIEAADAD
jgi:hypothetical protein